MTHERCARCGRSDEALERPPLPGELGRTLAERICAVCWKEWLARQVILINEHRLSPADPQHYAFLVREMRAFLGLEAAGPAISEPR